MRCTLTSLLLAAVAALGAFGFMELEVITMTGSDTMLPMAQRWAETYQAGHPNVAVVVTGGGTSAGIAALLNGTTDICTASRPLLPEERDQLKGRFGSPGVEIRAARDGVSIIVHPSNPVRELSMEQLREILAGRIVNWKQVGGRDARIALYGRENSSGTYTFLRQHVLNNGEFAPATVLLPVTSALVGLVERDSNGIGYAGFGYVHAVKPLAIKRDASSPAVFASRQTVDSGEYPLSRYLYLYLRNRPAGELKAFVEWIESAEGQAAIRSSGYFPID